MFLFHLTTGLIIGAGVLTHEYRNVPELTKYRFYYTGQNLKLSVSRMWMSVEVVL